MQELRQFMQHIAAVKPPFQDLMQNGIPGSGASNVAADQTHALYRAAHGFAQAYQHGRREELARAAAETEAALAGVVTYGVLSMTAGDQLVEELYGLAQAKSSQAAK